MNLLFGKEGSQRMPIRQIALSLLRFWAGISVLAMTCGCGKPLTPSDLPGTYVAQYGFATESVTIKGDGHFIQTIQVKTDGKVVVTNGTWHFNQDAQDIVFDENFMTVMNGFGEMVAGFDHSSRKAISILPVRRSLGRLQIGLDPDIPYKKQAN